MEIKKQFLQKYLEDIAIDQLAEEYQQKGYITSKKELLGKRYEVDLIAEKDNEVIVFEVKSGKLSQDRKQQIKELANYIRKKGNYKFQVVVATPPKEKKLEIEGIEQMLTLFMMNNIPDDLDQLSTHTRLQEVTDVDIDEIIIKDNEVFVSGYGVVSVEVQFGSDNDNNLGDGLNTRDSFPFSFDITLEFSKENILKIVNVEELEIDVSSYYGAE